MKILHVTQNYFPSIGGTQYTIQHVSEYLHAYYQDEVTVYTTDSYYGPNNRKYKKIVQANETLNGVNVQRFPFLHAHKPFLRAFSKTALKFGKERVPDIINAWNAGPMSISLKHAIKNCHADVIGASSVHYNFAEYGIWRNKLKHPKPFVLYGALHLGIQKIEPVYLRRIKAADHYIANTTFEKDFLIAQNIPPDKITVAGAGIEIHETAENFFDDVNSRRELKIEPHSKIILCICRQEAFKGLQVMLDAFRFLLANEKNIHCIIAGGAGNYTGVLKKSEEVLPELSIFTNISIELREQLLNIADVVVLPSKEESFGVIFLEAWRAGKPVIGAAIGAIASIIDVGENGYLFQPDNAHDLGLQIQKILKDKNHATRMGQNGYEKVKAFFTWEKIAGQFRTAYEKAIQNFELNKL